MKLKEIFPLFSFIYKLPSQSLWLMNGLLKKFNFYTFFSILIALGILTTVFTLFIVGIPKQKYIGSELFTFEDTANLNLTLDIKNHGGNVHVNYASNLSFLFYAELKFFGGKDVSIDQIAEFKHNETVGDIIISFEDNCSYDSKDSRYYYHDLVLFIHPYANISLNLSAGGEARFWLWSNAFPNFRKINVSCNSRLEFDLGGNSTFDCDNVNLVTDYGDIYVYSHTMKFETNFTWNIQSNEGDVNLRVYQWNTLVGTNSLYFNVQSNFGDIEANLVVDDEFYGWKLDANAPLCTVTWEPVSTGTSSVSVTSENFSVAESRIFFNFLSLNGNIGINR